MTNLLPKQNKKKNRNDYYLRLVSTTLILFSFVILIASILLVPSYYLTYLKKISGQAQIGVIENVVVQQEKDEANKILLETKQKLDLISSEGKSNLIEIIEAILEEKTGVIKINSFFWSGGVIGVNGISNTRDDLVEFVDRLEQNTLFANVDLPISDLATSREIEFSIKMKLIEI